MDAIRVHVPGIVSHNTIIDDNLTHWIAHRDGIQIIPKGNLPHSQYAGGLLDGVTISNNHIHSGGQLQGIFCSDGLLSNVEVSDNFISTNSQHKITLGGVLSGYISDNKTKGGYPCPIMLYPLRIGGNSDGGKNVWIRSFLNPDYQYNDINEIIRDYDPDYHIDYRLKFFDRDINLINFDIDGFKLAAQSIPPLAANDYCNQLKQLAVKYGDIIQRV